MGMVEHGSIKLSGFILFSFNPNGPNCEPFPRHRSARRGLVETSHYVTLPSIRPITVRVTVE